ncbi:LrgB family protein [Halotalea alkalilenta]|uniref:CidB/LrgB family autolysis modulator n=1 Tax=Halotalea alkalilenta TaxID=376489 RepID=A0A172YFS9_9GAMM|nr:LrgB family protein [Halotalea alkalilenta]ANF58074.1 hypothetical protein A5892_11860 [Halotalea alkalilenta]
MILTEIDTIWVYLSASPLLSLFLTISFYLGCYQLCRRFRLLRGVHPAVVTIIALICLLQLTGTSYQSYFEGAQFIHFLLGPATVMLAVPMFDNLARVRSMMMPLLSGCIAAVVASAFLTLGIATLLGAPPEIIASMAPKSVTVPIAMGVAESLGGIPALTAAIVLITGIIGCLTGPLVFRVLGVHDHTVKGFTMGASAHGFGTAQSFASISALAGAFSGLAMGCVGLSTAIMLPIFMRILAL